MTLTRRKKRLIELAYQGAEALGIPLWCQDEAGPYQTMPQQGTTWAPEGHPQLQPHEYIRTGTAKLLTLFRPATGEVRAQGVRSTTNAILHPWLQAELKAVLQEWAQEHPVVQMDEARPLLARWETWLGIARMRSPNGSLPMESCRSIHPLEVPGSIWQSRCNVSSYAERSLGSIPRRLSRLLSGWNRP